MRQILIIADDLSGAADCGMACAGSGLHTVVMLGNSVNPVNADVLSVDADTRGLDPKRAVWETAMLMRHYMSSREQVVFKKLDSTLRGNVGAELAAVLTTQRSAMTEQGHIVAVLAPAFPANGRTTRDGKQFLNGKPLEEMEIWQRSGIHGSSYIPAMLERAGMRSAVLPLETIRSSNGNLHTEMARLAEGLDVLVCDAEIDQDLQAIAKATVSLGHNTVWAGSAGLAYHLPKAIALTSTTSTVSNQGLATGPTLIVVGSSAALSREQVKTLSASPELATITIPPSDLLSGLDKRREHERLLAEAFAAKRDIVVMLGTEDKLKIDAGRLLSSALAQMIVPHYNKVGALVITGGETARLVLQTWGVTGLRLVKELEPGLPFSITENWSRRLPVITKAGDFGNPQTLVHCRQFLHDLDRTGKPASGK
jgi:4-hydroxythreonine-4-phosphate dehydrogenase